MKTPYSIIIPIHNELEAIPSLLNRLINYSKQGHEVIIINDGSDDGSSELLDKSDIIKLIELKNNEGKGYAIRQGLIKAKYSKIIIFDGDMELHHSGILKLMNLDRGNNINFIMGYRFKNLNPLKSNFDWGNFIFTSFFNILFQSHHKDILCCAKSFYIEDLKNYKLCSKGFDIDVELSSILTRLNKRNMIPQVLLKYKRRTWAEGKKLKISDGWTILSRIIKLTKFY